VKRSRIVRCAAALGAEQREAHVGDQGFGFSFLRA
jgi:hypothetical protein